jgi:hypothetical protein
MYTGSSSAFLTVTTEADGSRMNLRIGDAAAPLQNVVDEVEDALMTEAGMSYLMNGGGQVSIAELSTGSYLFLEDNVRLIRDTAGDVNATINGYVQSTQGIVIDSTNGGILYSTVTAAQRLIEYDGYVWVDPVAGLDSNIYPSGTRAAPCKTWANVKDILADTGLSSVDVHGTLTLTSSAATLTFQGESNSFDQIILNSQVITGCTFNKVRVTGTGTFDDNVRLDECSLNTIVGFRGTAWQSRVENTVSIGAGNASFLQSYSGIAGTGRPTYTITDAGSNVDFRAYSGGATIEGLATGNAFSFDAISATLEMGATCAGTPNTVIRGDVYLINTAALPLTDLSSRSAIKTVNEGVQKSSKLIPHSTDV